MAFSPVKKTVVTPRAKAHYLRADKPDAKFGDPKYGGTVILTAEDGKAILDTCLDLAGESFAAKQASKAKLPIQQNDDGTYSLRAKSQHQPTGYDAKGQKIARPIAIGNGSVVKLAITLSTYSTGANYGVTAYLNSIQIIKLQEYGGNPFGHEDDEDGFDAANAPAPAFGNETDAASDDADDDDGDF